MLKIKFPKDQLPPGTLPRELELEMEEFEQLVQQGDISPRTKLLFPPVTGKHWIEVKDLEFFHSLYSPTKILFTRYFHLSSFPVVTFAFVFINVLIFAYMFFTEDKITTEILLKYGAKSKPMIYELGQFWRLITANFIHNGPLHLLFNMIVFLPVGNALENAYRKVDFIILLIISALGTTIFSSILNNSVSAGASGVIFGALGSGFIFGYKYGNLIPQKYKSRFGWAIVPYVLGFLYLGFVDNNTDNWGHIGGLIAGTLISLVFSARLLLTSPKLSLKAKFIRGIPVFLILLLILSSSLMSIRVFPSFLVFNDKEYGISIKYPNYWRPQYNDIGYLAIGNGVGTTLGIGIREYVIPVDFKFMEYRFNRYEMEEAEEKGRITNLKVIPAKKISIAGLPGILIQSFFTKAGVKYALNNYILIRGSIEYIITLASPSEYFESYQELFKEMLLQVKIDEPDFVDRARRKLSSGTEDKVAALRFAQANIIYGNYKAAEKIYKNILKTEANEPNSLAGLARLNIYGYKTEQDGLFLIKRAVEVAGEDQEFALIEAGILDYNGKKTEAVAILEKYSQTAVTIDQFKVYLDWLKLMVQKKSK